MKVMEAIGWLLIGSGVTMLGIAVGAYIGVRRG